MFRQIRMSIERETMENVRKGVRNRCVAGLLTLGAAVSLAACGMPQEEVGGELSAAGEAAEQETESTEADGAESVSGEQSDASAEEEGAAEDADDLRNTVSLDGNTVTTPYFTAQIPESWEDRFQWSVYEHEGGYSLSFEDQEAAEYYGSGNLCSIQVSPEVPVYIQYIGGDFVGVIENPEGEVRYLSVSYPTEAPFGGDILERYLEMEESAEALCASVEAAGSWEMQQKSYEEVMADVESTVSGVMADASMHSFTLQDYNGRMITFSGADLDLANLSEDGVHPGHCYEVTYRGVLGEDGSTEHAVFVSLENRDADAPAKDYDACYYATQVKMALSYQDMSYLAQLCRFPLVLDGREIQTAEEFAALDFDAVFSEELLRNVTYCDLYHAEMTGDSFSISLLQKAPEIVIGKIGEGQWAITAIRNQ